MSLQRLKFNCSKKLICDLKILLIAVLVSSIAVGQTYSKNNESLVQGFYYCFKLIYFSTIRVFSLTVDLHFHQETSASHRIKRNVFLDMIEDFTGADEDDEASEEDEEYESISDSVESTTTRFGRFISPLAFSKISETLGFIVSVIYILL